LNDELGVNCQHELRVIFKIRSGGKGRMKSPRDGWAISTPSDEAFLQWLASIESFRERSKPPPLLKSFNRRISKGHLNVVAQYDPACCPHRAESATEGNN
jgi:hypothetical protein